MDATFHLRARRLLDRSQPARLDHAMLVALVAAQRTTSALRLEATAAPPCDGGDEPLVELILAGPGWRRAASVQRGCFNRAESERRVNGA